ncbi:hypothetical protein D3W54_15940 (plasmid) [Komagataeibacter medellinensis]|uniref:Uncharacterized protein n=2 Tax=Komagataeibacter TaxID=1434011 RepID=A0A9N7H3V3_9PROT|nr:MULTISPECIES: hypothetical protein [Komagataeibacter]AQU89373.1 hypothetical protein B0W47_17620 [Komagataeibacter nataicola]KAB8122199.1 hypothetical protein D3W54_15940 [Komagataeibacter medellinensis]PYD64870.1 hypothetical protein CDI09_16820 [Komagataeibacter nataicola]WNM07333.1 hypothetical protein RI056_00385 [Komagataeibacter nataicola]
MNDDFGIRKKPADRDSTLEKVDRVAEKLGFASREGRKRRNAVGPTMPVNVKLPEDTYNAFLKFCDDNELTYRKGIEKLLIKAGYIEE